jgi:hypothetical protein
MAAASSISDSRAIFVTPATGTRLNSSHGNLNRSCTKSLRSRQTWERPWPIKMLVPILSTCFCRRDFLSRCDAALVAISPPARQIQMNDELQLPQPRRSCEVEPAYPDQE